MILRSHSTPQAPTTSPTPGTDGRTLIAVSVLAAAIVFAHGNSLSKPFQFDDFAPLQNEAVRQSIPTVTPRPQLGVQVAGRPIVRLSFALNYALGGIHVTGYHALNIGVHIVCALLFFLLIRGTLSRWASPEWQRRAFSLALCSTLIWALHPLNTGTVTYISARSESLMAMWYLSTLFAAMQAHDSTYRAAWSVAAVVFCALGMATKESMVTAPLLVLLCDRAFAFSSFRQAFLERGRLYVALAATWSILAVLMLTGARADSVGFSLGVSSWTYLLNQAEIITDYLRRSLWPHPLVFAYGEPRALTLGDVFPQGVLILSLVALACWSWWRAPRIGLLALAFFVVLMPTSSVVPIATEVGAERRMYLPLMTLVLLIVLIGQSIWKAIASRSAPTWWRLAGATVPILVCALLAALTIQRNTEYATEESLWRSTLDRWPSAIAHRNLATALLQLGRGNEAIEHLRATVAEHPEMHHPLGQTLFEQGRFDEALVELRTFLEQAAVPGSNADAIARALTALTLEKLRRSDEARDLLQQLIARRPDYAPAYLALGDVHFRRKEFTQAQHAYRRYLTFQPANEGALTNLGIAALNSGQLDDAIETLQRVVDARPQAASGHCNLAIALANAGRFDDAIAHVDEAMRLAPADASIRELAQQIHTARPVNR